MAVQEKYIKIPRPTVCLSPQGLMFGYATDETEECMPLTIVLAHKLNAKMAELRRTGTIPWLRPDSKTQVSVCFMSQKRKQHRRCGVLCC